MTQTELDEWAGPEDAVPEDESFEDAYPDPADYEPDYEAMYQDRMEGRFGGLGEALEWGGMDLPS